MLKNTHEWLDQTVSGRRYGAGTTRLAVKKDFAPSIYFTTESVSHAVFWGSLKVAAFPHLQIVYFSKCFLIRGKRKKSNG